MKETVHIIDTKQDELIYHMSDPHFVATPTKVNVLFTLHLRGRSFLSVLLGNRTANFKVEIF